MKHTTIVILLFFCMIIGFKFLSPLAKADEVPSVSLNLKGYEPRLEQGLPIMVAGFWHTINFSIEERASDLYLFLYQGTSIPSEKNERSYYEWMYDSSEGFRGTPELSYASLYIDEEACSATETNLEFCVGVKDTLPNSVFYRQNWTLELYRNGQHVMEKMFWLEKPTKGLAKIHGDRIECSVDPFKELTVEAGDYIMLKNTGNVPLGIDLRYTELDSVVDFETIDDMLAPLSTGTYRVFFHAHTLQPQFITAEGTATASVPNDLMILEGSNISSTVFLQSSLVLDIPIIEIFVGHSTYQLMIMDDSPLSYQYRTSVSIQEGKSKDLHVYISGNGQATLAISPRGPNITMSNIRMNGEQLQQPLSILSTVTQEQRITVAVKALSEGHHEYIDYTLTTQDETKTFSTKILVTPPSINDDDTVLRSSSMVILVICAFVFAGGYILISFIRHRRKR